MPRSELVPWRLDEIRFERDRYAVDGGSSLSLRPSLMSGGESITYDSAVLSYSLDNSVDCRIDAATGVLTAANVQGRQCVLTVGAAGKSTSVTVDIGVPPVVIENFEGNTAAYAAGGARFRSVRIDKVGSPAAFDGQYSMKLSWQAAASQRCVGCRFRPAVPVARRRGCIEPGDPQRRRSHRVPAERAGRGLASRRLPRCSSTTTSRPSPRWPYAAATSTY